MSQAGMRTAANKANKKNYTALTPAQKRIIKLLEENRQVDKELNGYNGFYSSVKRLSINAVDWDSLSDLENKIFTSLHNRMEKASAKLAKIDCVIIEKAQSIFNQTQFYGGSF